MSSGPGRSPCDTDPREFRLDVICPAPWPLPRDGTMVPEIAQALMSGPERRLPTRRAGGTEVPDCSVRPRRKPNDLAATDQSCVTRSTEISTAVLIPLFSSQCLVFLSSGQPTPGP